MRCIACLLSEWRIARVRLLRTRLGVWLGLLVGGLAVVAGHRGGPAPAVAALEAAMLAAILAVAYTLGSDLDRAAVVLTLTHPTSALAVAAGRWMAATAVAGAAGTVVLAAAALLGRGAPLPSLSAAAAVVGGAATAAVALPVALAGGNTPLTALFLYIALLGSTARPPISGGPTSSLAPVGALAWVVPTPWRYAELGRGDAAAWGHAAFCVTGGLGMAALLLRRFARR